MEIVNPKGQTNDQIVQALLANTKKQYTEAAHAEIFGRLINTIEAFNKKAARTEKFMLLLALAQVILAMGQIFLAFIQISN